MSRSAVKTTLVVVALAAVAGVCYWLLIPIPRQQKNDLKQREGVWCLKATDEPFTGIMFEADAKGQLLSEIPLKKGLAHGIARGWHPNGQLEVEEPFAGGKSNGKRTRYHPNGKVRSTATIVEGTLHGPFQEFHDNGQLAVEMTLVKGVGQGPSRAWYPSGQLKAEAVLVDGQPETVTYHEDTSSRGLQGK